MEIHCVLMVWPWKMVVLDSNISFLEVACAHQHLSAHRQRPAKWKHFSCNSEQLLLPEVSRCHNCHNHTVDQLLAIYSFGVLHPKLIQFGSGWTLVCLPIPVDLGRGFKWTPRHA